MVPAPFLVHAFPANQSLHFSVKKTPAHLGKWAGNDVYRLLATAVASISTASEEDMSELK